MFHPHSVALGIQLPVLQARLKACPQPAGTREMSPLQPTALTHACQLALPEVTCVTVRSASSYHLMRLSHAARQGSHACTTGGSEQPSGEAYELQPCFEHVKAVYRYTQSPSITDIYPEDLEKIPSVSYSSQDCA